MATISTLNIEGTTHQSRQATSVPYVVDLVVDFADVLVEKGSALAADDIIETINVPANTAVLAAGIQTMTVDDSTTLTLHLGITGGDIDEWVVSYDNAAAAAGDYAPGLLTDPTPVIFETADTIYVELATLTGTLTVGKIRVWAILVDISEQGAGKNPGIALIGS